MPDNKELALSYAPYWSAAGVGVRRAINGMVARRSKRGRRGAVARAWLVDLRARCAEAASDLVSRGDPAGPLRKKKDVRRTHGVDAAEKDKKSPDRPRILRAAGARGSRRTLA